MPWILATVAAAVIATLVWFLIEQAEYRARAEANARNAQIVKREKTRSFLDGIETGYRRHQSGREMFMPGERP